jgi:hypothetical protein
VTRITDFDRAEEDNSSPRPKSVLKQGVPQYAEPRKRGVLMSSLKIYLFVAAVLAAAPIAHGDINPSEIENQLKGLRSVASDQKPAIIVKLATDIRALPAGTQKLGYADALSHLATEGDPGHDALQAVVDTLSAALTESPVPAKGDKIPMPYHQVAILVRYEGVTTTLKDPLYDRAAKMLADNEADIQKADFTLTNLKNKKVTLSELRGKIVLVNLLGHLVHPVPRRDGRLGPSAALLRVTGSCRPVHHRRERIQSDAVHWWQQVRTRCRSRSRRQSAPSFPHYWHPQDVPFRA